MKQHYLCLSVADVRGNTTHYSKIKRAVIDEEISFVFLCGDLLPKTGGSWSPSNKVRTIQLQKDFITDYFLDYLAELGRYAEVYAIFGNDDFRSNYPLMQRVASGRVHFLNNEVIRLPIADYKLYAAGYPYVALTPFLQKDWEKWDTERGKLPHKIYKSQGYTSENGKHYSVDFAYNGGGRATIAEDLQALARKSNPNQTIYIFHEAPFGTPLDMVAADNKYIKNGQLHVGSPAIREFIGREQPLLTMHGHIHETFRESGKYEWRHGASISVTAANDFTSDFVAFTRFTLPEIGVLDRVTV